MTEDVRDLTEELPSEGLLIEAGISTRDMLGMSIRQIPVSWSRTLATIENPLSSDSALYLRRWCAEFPTAVQRRRLRDLRDQFAALLEDVR
jgi:hypothetical protein